MDTHFAHSADAALAIEYWWPGDRPRQKEIKSGDFQWRMDRLQEAFIRIRLPQMGETERTRAQRTLAWLAACGGQPVGAAP